MVAVCLSLHSPISTVMCRSPFYSGVLSATPNPSGRKSVPSSCPQQVLYAYPYLWLRGACQLASSPEDCVDFGRLLQKTSVISVFFLQGYCQHHHSLHQAGLMAAPSAFSSWLISTRIHSCQRRFLFHFLG